MTETEAVERHVYAVLAASAPLAAIVSTRIYHRMAPQGSALPYIAFQVQAATDRRYVGTAAGVEARPLYVEIDFQVSARDQGGDLTAAYSAIEKVQTALQVSGTQGQYHIVRPVRTQTLVGELVEYGVRFPSVNAFYTVIVFKTPS